MFAPANRATMPTCRGRCGKITGGGNVMAWKLYASLGVTFRNFLWQPIVVISDEIFQFIVHWKKQASRTHSVGRVIGWLMRLCVVYMATPSAYYAWFIKNRKFEVPSQQQCFFILSSPTFQDTEFLLFQLAACLKINIPLPKLNIACENRPKPKGQVASRFHHFSGAKSFRGIIINPSEGQRKEWPSHL